MRISTVHEGGVAFGLGPFGQMSMVEPSGPLCVEVGIGKVTTLIWADGSYRDAYQLALQDFLGKCVPEIVRLFEAPRTQRDAPGSL